MAEQRNSNYAPAAPKQGDSDLYAQIAAGDQEEEKIAKAKSSFVMNLMIEYMRLTLLIDSKRRQYQKLFRILGGIWAIIMLLLYLLGLAMLLILIVGYMRFPTEIKEYFEKNGVLFEDMQIPGYIISQVELKGIHDKGNTYRIDSLSISSTFADFLNRRVRNASAKGVRFTIDPSGEMAENPLQILSRLHQDENGNSDLKIDSLEISNAIITIKGKDYSLPVSLSLTGIYGNETNISGYVKIDEPFLKVNGPLSIRNEKDAVLWELNVASGQIAFPGRALEKMKGTFGIKTKHLKLHSILTDMSFFTNQERRDVKLSLEKNKDLFSGTLSVKWVDGINTIKQIERTKLDLMLSDLKLSPNGSVQTQSPVRMSLTTKYSPDLHIIAMTGTFMGELTCQLFETCSYRLDKPASITAKRVSVRNRGVEIRNKSRFQFSLEPVVKLMDISFKTGRMNFDLKTKNFIFNGEEIETKAAHVFKANMADLSGHFNLWNKDVVTALSLREFNYQTPSLSLEEGRLKADNIFDDNSHIYLNSPKVTLKNNSQIKIPFSLTYSKDKGVAGITAMFEHNRAQILFGGTFDWISGYINGQLVVPTVDLASLKQPLNRISDLIPETFKKTTGKVSVYGRLSGNLYSDLSGPLYISLMNFGFETDQLKIQNIDTVLAARSVRPFITEPEQKIHIGSIESFLPISDIDIVFKAEDNYAQLKELSANVSGVRLYAGETVVPYKNIGTLIYLRNKDENLTNIAKVLQVKNWKNIGSIYGNILFPIEVKNMSLNIRNAILQISSAEMEYAGPAKDKPASMDKNTKFSVTSGTVSIDTSAQNELKENKISVLLDATLLPSRLKKTIRYVSSENLSNVITFRPLPNTQVSPELLSQINHIHQLANKFRIK